MHIKSEKRRQRVVAFIVGNEPAPIAVKKIELLNSFDTFDVHLIHRHRLNSNLSLLLKTQIPNKNIHSISLPDPQGGVLRRLVLNFYFMFSITLKIFKIKPDIIHAINLDIGLLALPLSYIKKKTCLVLDIQDTREIFLNAFLKALIKRLLNKIDLIFVTSPKYITDFLVKFNPNVYMKNNLFVPNAPSIKDFEGFHKKQGGELTVGYFGFFRGKEAINNLVLVTDKLRKNGLKISVFFAGTGPDLPLVEKLSDEYAFVHYHGPYYYEEIKKLYERVDILYALYFLDHNRKINMSCRYSEAAVCNLPVIVQDGSYMAELVRKYQTGYVLEFGRWEELKNLLRRLCLDRSDLDVKAANCEAIKEENIFETYSPEITKAYLKLLA